VCLSAILATRDAVTPLRMVAIAAALNFVGDWLLCCWPLRTGVAGAAAATAIANITGFFLMIRALRTKGMTPRIRFPSREDISPVLEYAGPLSVIVTARVVSFTSMAIAAANLGTTALAAYQLILGVFVVFAFVGAPLSSNAQSILPPLLDAGDVQGTRRAGKNIVVIATSTAGVVAALCFSILRFGAPIFTTDPAVLQYVANTAPAILLITMGIIMSSSVDGSLMAAKDFGFIVPAQLAGCGVQLLLIWLVIQRKLGLPWVFITFFARQILFIATSAARVACGCGALGRVIVSKVPQS